MERINNQMGNIESQYRKANKMTYAEAEMHKNMVSEQYYENTKEDYIKKLEQKEKLKNENRTRNWAKVRAENMTLIRQRSDEKLKRLEELKQFEF
jgi:hypothetical protein